MKRVIAITGGIGTGKSVVCHILSALGFPIYDCDSQAKTIMDTDSEMKQRIAHEITPRALNHDQSLNRAEIAKVVFSSPEKLNALNSIVHGAVREHFIKWADAQTAQTVFVETAILYESRFNELVSEIWEVTAPMETRIKRIAMRSGLTHNEILNRISSQKSESHRTHTLIVNDSQTPLLPQILPLI